MIFLKIFDAKIINGKGEGSGERVVFAKAWGEAHWVVAMGCQVGDKAFKSNDAGLF